MPREEPIPLSDALTKVARQLGLPPAGVFEIVAACWNEVAGPELAAHSHVRSVHDGECTIAVDGPGWSTRARYLTSELEQLANSRNTTPLVSTVKVIVSAPGKAV